MPKKKKPDTSTAESTSNLPELNSNLLYSLIYGDKERDKDLYLSAINTLLASDLTSAKILELYQNLLSGDNTVSGPASKSLDQLFSRTVRKLKSDANLKQANKKIQEIKEQANAAEVQKKVARAKRTKQQPAVVNEPVPEPEAVPSTPRKPKKTKLVEPTSTSAPRKPRTKKTKPVGEVGDGTIISAIEEATPTLPTTVDVGETITSSVTPSVEAPGVSTTSVGETITPSITSAAISKEELAKNMGLVSRGGNLYGPVGRNVVTHRFQNGKFVPIRKPTESNTPGSTITPPTPSEEGELITPPSTPAFKNRRKGRGRSSNPTPTPSGGTITPPPPPSSGGGATPPPTPPPVGGTAVPPPPPPPGNGGGSGGTAPIASASIFGGIARILLTVGKRLGPILGGIFGKIFKRKSTQKRKFPKAPRIRKIKKILKSPIGKVLRSVPLIGKSLVSLALNKAIIKQVKKLSQILNKISSLFEKFVNDIRKIQLQFGTNAGIAARIKVGSIVESAKSYVTSALSGFQTAPVSAKQIQDVMGTYQEEFGGILETESARTIAERGVRLGLTPEMQAKARRTFITTTLGDKERAVSAEEKFMAEFEAKGLTGGEALKIAAQYSELIARNGNRFSTSFARAAADAKKIGVNLQNVDKIGDNIIGNFEGFLESQAELGAMGFGFDTSRLAELAETGDTGALFNELRSQLAATGKDITKLRRSEQLALSQAFGISMEEIQRLAGKTSGSGEKTRTDLFESMNTGFSQLVNAMDFTSAILSGIATVVSSILFLMKNNMGGGMLGGILGKVIGVLGGLISVLSAYGAGKTKNTSGIITSILGGAASGFMIGGGPWGAAIGGLLAAGSAAYGYSKADDMISKPGYGERALVTPKGVVSLNNSDKVVAYADDMMATQAGIQTMPKGSIVKESETTSPQVNIDLSKLEAKMDRVITAIGNMGIYMDGNKVGKVLVNSSDATSVGVFRTQARATL